MILHFDQLNAAWISASIDIHVEASDETCYRMNQSNGSASFTQTGDNH